MCGGKKEILDGSNPFWEEKNWEFTCCPNKCDGCMPVFRYAGPNSPTLEELSKDEKILTLLSEWIMTRLHRLHPNTLKKETQWAYHPFKCGCHGFTLEEINDA